MDKGIEFSLVKINTEQFAILAETLPQGDKQFQVELIFKFAQKERVIAVVVNFLFVSENNPFMKLSVSGHFQVEDNAWKSFEQEDGRTVIPKGFLCHLAMHTVGMARGILHCKTEGTSFNAVILPPINVTRLVDGDVEVK